jgi:predicted phosphodiesterase
LNYKTSRNRREKTEIQPQAPPSSPPEEVKILHFSDPHCGYGFKDDQWKDLLNWSENNKPHLIIISGDFVNSPWRWCFRDAKRKVEKLREKAGSHECLTVPGNHDTRILGIVPVAWIYPCLLTAAAVLTATTAFGMVSSRSWYLLIAVAILIALRFALGGTLSVNQGARLLGIVRVAWIDPALFAAAAVLTATAFGIVPYFGWYLLIAVGILIALRFALIGKFESYFPQGEHLRVFENLGLEIFTFDSASVGPYWAQGLIAPRQFIDSKEESKKRRLAAPESRPFRIGVLHHHAMPIPYEQEAEPMMVLRNAGALLQQAGSLGISLVLHGHRHRFAFSRVTVAANAEDSKEIAILSTGSATAGTEEDHNFNLITVNRWGAVKITPYWSHKDATFEESPSFWARSIEDSARQFFQVNAQAQGCYCESTYNTFDINADGDAQQSIEFRGFRPVRGRYLDEAPGAIGAGSTVGHLERIRLDTLASSAGQQITLEGLSRTIRTYSAKIRFQPKLDSANEPVNFALRYYAINSYAMSERQFKEMYPPRPGQARESCYARVSNVPTAELVIIVRLPAGFKVKVNGSPGLSVFRADKSADIELQKALQGNLRYDPILNLITMRVPFPPLDRAYRLEWQLPEVWPLPKGLLNKPVTLSQKGMTSKAATKMLKLAESDPYNSPLNMLGPEILKVATEAFKLAEGDQTLEFSIMAYDPKTLALRVAAANFVDRKDPRWIWPLPYGDGIAGRVYKNNFAMVVVKQFAIDNGLPFYYLPVNDQYVSDNGGQMPAVMVSVPLCHKENPQEMFAVLSISSSDPASKLVDVTGEEMRTTNSNFAQAVADACLMVLETVA